MADLSHSSNRYRWRNKRSTSVDATMYSVIHIDSRSDMNVKWIMRRLVEVSASGPRNLFCDLALNFTGGCLS